MHADRRQKEKTVEATIKSERKANSIADLSSMQTDGANKMVAAIDDADLETWGFPRATFFQPVEEAARRGNLRLPSRPPLDRFQLQRKILVRLRRNIDRNAFGRLVRRTRLLCDVLLRG